MLRKRVLVLRNDKTNSFHFYRGIAARHNPANWPGYTYLRSFSSVKSAIEFVEKNHKQIPQKIARSIRYSPAGKIKTGIGRFVDSNVFAIRKKHETRHINASCTLREATTFERIKPTVLDSDRKPPLTKGNSDETESFDCNGHAD